LCIYVAVYELIDLIIADTNYKKGRSTAIGATARKLAVIIWNMSVKGEPYKPPTEYLFLDQKRKMKLINNIKKNITKFNLKPQDVGFNLNADFQ